MYNQKELDFIHAELDSLAIARQENKYSRETKLEWIKDFFNDGYPAEYVCRIIRLTKTKNLNYKIKYSDFTNFDYDEMKSMKHIIPIQIKQLPPPEPKPKEGINWVAKIRNELGISFFDFSTELYELGRNKTDDFLEKGFNYYKNNPAELQKLQEKYSKAKNNFNQIIKQAL